MDSKQLADLMRAVALIEDVVRSGRDLVAMTAELRTAFPDLSFGWGTQNENGSCHAADASDGSADDDGM